MKSGLEAKKDRSRNLTSLIGQNINEPGFETANQQDGKVAPLSSTANVTSQTDVFAISGPQKKSIYKFKFKDSSNVKWLGDSNIKENNIVVGEAIDLRCLNSSKSSNANKSSKSFRKKQLKLTTFFAPNLS